MQVRQQLQRFGSGAGTVNWNGSATPFGATQGKEAQGRRMNLEPTKGVFVAVRNFFIAAL
jgi:hypothetical protein